MDGLIEAIQKEIRQGEAGGVGPSRKELFGKDRLEQALLSRQVHNRRAKDAIDLILAAAQDQGFTIEDDITVQVYRHV